MCFFSAFVSFLYIVDTFFDMIHSQKLNYGEELFMILLTLEYLISKLWCCDRTNGDESTALKKACALNVLLH